MRCLTIADALADKVAREAILFVCSDTDSAQIAEKRGYEALVLDTDYKEMEAELKLWPQLSINNAVILVDSYYITDSYLKALSDYGKVILMDDMQNHSYSVDGVINYNIFADSDIYQRLYHDTDKCYLGCAYAPIRKQFIDVKYVVKSKITDILITTGGADSLNIAGTLYDSLNNTSAIDSSINYHIVSGIFNPFYNELKDKEALAGNLRIYHNVSNMAELMQKCDVAITAAGSTVYELAAIGVPMITLSYADNQVAGAEYIGQHIATNAGKYDKDPQSVINNIKAALIDEYSDIEYRKLCKQKENKLVDGLGANRIADILISYKL